MSKSARNAVDYLYEWAIEQGDWAILLTNKVISGNPLSDGDRDEIIDSLISSQGKATSTGNGAVISNNVYERIRLNKLSEISGVNKLAQGQEMTFHDNLTIVYGDNGSGKTGYYRILKSIGSSVEKDSHPQILSNVFSKPELPSALIDYTMDGTSQPLHWTNNNETIPGVVVFDSKCASVSIDSKRKTNLKPIGFEYFNTVSQELILISNRMGKKISELSAQLLTKEFSKNTASKIFFEGLTWSDEEEKIDKFNVEGILTLVEVEKKLSQLAEAGKELNPEILNHQIKNCGVVKSECERHKAIIEELKTDFSKEKITEYFSALDENKKTTEVIPEFNDFLTVAHKYVNKHCASTYPAQGDKCIYCGQLLSKDAVEHIHYFQSILQSGSAKKFEQNKVKIANFDRAVSMLQPLPYKQEIFGLIETCGDLLKLSTTLNTYINNFKIIIEDKTLPDEEHKKILEFSYDELLTQCKEYSDKIDKEVESRKEKLEHLQELITKNQNSTAEWTDYKWVIENREKIKRYLSILKTIHTYEVKNSTLNSRRLSVKMKSAEKELITDTYKTTLSNEFQRLRCPNDINVDVSISNSEPSIKQNIQKNDLDEVLSEGEQKVVSLAEFITEALIDDQIQVLIFDDPVNSLDICRSEEIAKRLAKLSEQKQVVVFTHSLIFFNDLQNAIEKKDQTYYTIQADVNCTGYVYAMVAPKDESYKKYMDEVLDVLKREGKRTNLISEELRDGYSSLRSALECLYEKEFLKDTILRFRRSIMTGRLKDINWNVFDSQKQSFIDIFDRACTAIKGHTNADGIVRPTMQDLKKDYEETEKIKKTLA
jgi:energy-coupling factor transporter ATP-binding protein EcfA2